MCCSWYLYFFLAIICYFLYKPLLIRLYYNPISKRKLEVLLKKRQDEIEKISQFVKSVNLSPEKSQKIISNSLLGLGDLLRSKTVTSTEILAAYYHQCITEGLKLNGVASFNSAWAIKRAKEIDDEIKSSNFTFKDKSLFYGIPVSVKECHCIKDIPCTLGVVSWSDVTSKKDSELIVILKEKGGIPFVTSNVPYLMLTHDTVNPVWGNAKNPKNNKKSVAGSSGGEACLLASKCSPIGFGNDLSGSLRMPSAFCGTYAVLPGNFRISIRDNNPFPFFSNEVQNYIPSVTGPMGRSVDDLVATMRFFYSPSIIDRDRTCVPLYWRESLYESGLKGKLKLGYWKGSKFLPITAPCQKSVEKAINIIKKKDLNIEVIPFEIPEEFFLDLCVHIYTLFMNDGMLIKLLKNELNESLPSDVFLGSLGISSSNWLKKVLYVILSALGEKRSAILFKDCKAYNGDGFVEFANRIRLLQAKMIELFNMSGVNAIMVAGFQTPAFDIGQSADQGLNVFSHGIWNIVQFVGGIMPYGVAQKEDTQPEHHYKDMMQKAINKCLADSEGLPTSLMLISTPFNEEKVLGILKRLDLILNSNA